MIETSSPAPARRASVIFIFITIVLDVLAMGIIIPVLPRLVTGFMRGDTASAAEIYGVFGTVWAFMQFVSSPVLGALSDRFGRRPVILVSSFGLGLDFVLMALAPTLGWLFVGRVLSGITSAGFTTAGAYIADVTPPEKRAAGFGMLGAAFGLGFVLGPAVGGILGGMHPRLPFWVAAGLTLVNATYGLFVLPESLPLERRAGFSWRRANPVGALSLLRSHPEVLGLAGVMLLYNLAHESLPSVFVLYAGYRFGWGELFVGLTLAGAGVAAMIVQGGLVRPIVARFGERRAIFAGLAFGAVGFAIYGLAPTGPLFLIGIPVMAFWGLFGPAAQSLMTHRVGLSEQGQLQGALNSLRGITGLIGPTLFTQIFARFIDAKSPVKLPGAPFLLATLLLIGAGAIALGVTRGLDRKSAGEPD
jgi:DHA1 family tetracycline resistance protein-like MFS transporter